ncbi:MAG: DUF2336 domain-containing protein [Alphaproteobacteria bacterium]|nr:DUF2336 domain-containing protein [Alphaproteobacteria bacterium]
MALFGLFGRKKEPPTALKRVGPSGAKQSAAAPARRKLIPQDITYEEAKTLARAPDRHVRAELASRDDAQPELLYFLAEDKEADVRRSVAANNITPRQADLVLARDRDDEVRCDLALKIGRLIPGISQMANNRLQEVTLDVLQVLARDQLPRVRAIIAEEIKHATQVPQQIISKLARDVELSVAAPILEYSPLLSDHELMEIISVGSTKGGVSAIAKRNKVSPKLAQAIVEANDIAATATLLANPNVRLKPETLDRVVDVAEQNEPLHEPLARRAELSVGAIRRIAGFVSAAILQVMQHEHALDEETAKVVNDAVEKRLRDEEANPEQLETAAAKVVKLKQAGKLTEDAIVQAAEQGQRGFVAEALALKAEIPVAAVNKMIESRSGKASTAVSWKAGLSARGAMKLQQLAARVPANAMIHARDGVKYALSDAEMEWFLTYFREQVEAAAT